MHAYLGGIIRRKNGVAEIIGGVDDHIHLLISLRPAHCLADIVRDLKKDSTNWIKDNFDRNFSWQEGYAVFTVSPTAVERVRRYISRQELHHSKQLFIDELKELLHKAAVGYDENISCESGTLTGCRIKATATGGLRLRFDLRLLSAQPFGL
jgi:hypothetical protein